MTRVANWNPNAFDQEFEDVAIDRLVDAGEILADATRDACPVGTVTRPMYQTGPYRNQPWTSRDAGRLKKSVRVVQKRGKSGKVLMSKRNVRVITGHYLAYYAAIVEYYHAFMRPALARSLSRMKEAIGAK